MHTQQTPGHLYGPPACHIGFWYGDHYLGEVRGHPSDVPAAQAKLMRHLEMLGHGEYWCSESGNRGRLANYERAVVYCGNFAIDVDALHAREDLARLVEEEAQAQRSKEEDEARQLIAAAHFNKASWH